MLKILQIIDGLLGKHGRNDKIAKQVLAAFVIVAISTGIRATLPVPILPYLLFIPGIIASGLLFGPVTGLASVVFSTLSAIYYFLPPNIGFVIQDFAQGLSITLFVIVTAAITLVCSTLRSTLLGLERRIATEVASRNKVEDALRQSQKMEAVGQLTGGLAHDLHNSAQAISGSLELIRRNVDRGTYQKLPRYLDVAEHATQSASDLTGRLLSFSRRQTLEPRVIDACALVRNFEPILRRTLPEVEIKIVCGASWPVMADPGQLESAILNLCINARDAMPQGGTITVGTCDRALDHDEAADRGLPPGDYVSVRVTDTGIGMSPDVIERAFDPFFTTKAIGQGTGLGLSQVYGFARQSGGNAKIHSKLGEGTRICLLLPRHPGPIVMPTPSIPTISAKASGEIILVVDDEVGVRIVVVEALEELGYTVLEANDGEEGLSLLKSDTPIDLLLSDVCMPRMDGPSMVEAGRAFRPTLPVLFVTGYASDFLSKTGLDQRTSVLAKPFQISELADRVQAAMASR